MVNKLSLMGQQAIFDGQQQGSCSCDKSIEHPCSHAIACIRYLGQDPNKYFALYYKWKSLQRTYELPLQPVTLEGLNL
jgi:hypothetical protein